MPVKRRLSKERAHRITPEAVEAFRARDFHRLHSALNLAPWETSPIEVRNGPSPWPAGSGGDDSWPKAQELRRELMAAVAERT